MTDLNPVEPVGQEAPVQSIQTINRPMAIWVFGVLNIVAGCYFLVRMIYSWHKIITGVFKNPDKIPWGIIPFLLLGLVGIGLAIWLIVLGIGLLKMKRWARHGSVLYAWIQIVFMVIILGATVVSSITDWENAPRILRGSINIGNGLVVIQWIYMV